MYKPDWIERSILLALLFIVATQVRCETPQPAAPAINVHPDVGYHQTEFFQRLNLSLRENFTKWLAALPTAASGEWRIYISDSKPNEMIIILAQKPGELSPFVEFVLDVNPKGKNVQTAIERELKKLKEQTLQGLKKSRKTARASPLTRDGMRFLFLSKT